jgi:hypothetical protein
MLKGLPSAVSFEISSNEHLICVHQPRVMQEAGYSLCTLNGV